MPIIEIKTDKKLTHSEIYNLIQESILEHIQTRFHKLGIPCSPVYQTRIGFRFDLKLGITTGILIENGHVFIEDLIEDLIEGETSKSKVITFAGDRFDIVGTDYHSAAILSEIVDVLLDEFDHVKGQELYDQVNMTELSNIAWMFGEKHRWVTPDAVYIDDADKDFHVIIEADGHLISAHAEFEVNDEPVFEIISRHCALPAKAVRLTMNKFRDAYNSVEGV
ncbi:hypothetical protein [Aeromonas dhakensis]|uniref:hypothetical protein n=1 Tax=Aeromonas dhakensis TaxID=196024 RepID=UPI002B46C2B8|nr:hypothetical protein [Aeromonas dhakensis]